VFASSTGLGEELRNTSKEIEQDRTTVQPGSFSKRQFYGAGAKGKCVAICMLGLDGLSGTMQGISAKV